MKNQNMKKTLIAVTSLLIICNSLFAQKCKPDYAAKDKMTREQIESWNQKVYEPGMGSRMLTTTDYYLTISIGHKGELYAITVTLTRADESIAKSLLETQYQASKGDIFMFGFADGEPISFTANEASTIVNVQPAIGNVPAKLITTITLQKTMSLEEILVFKDRLTTQKVQAVRVNLSNVKFEPEVKDSKAEKLLTKFTCFYNMLGSL